MFGGGFKVAKCKTLLRLAMSRVKLLRNKRDVVIKQMRKDIAQLLSSGQDTNARIRVEHVARELNIMAAYDLIELFCELIIVRLPIIESHKVCPMDLKEAICSLIFASPRCADLPELQQIRSVFSSKYGKEFVAAALELRPDCGVNRKVVEKLSVRTPSGETKLKLLTEIADEYHINWDPAATLAELLKQPEDLLEGPRKFFSASEEPIPEPQPPRSKTAQPPGSFPQQSNSSSTRPRSSLLENNQSISRRAAPAADVTSLSISDSVDDESRGNNRFRRHDGGGGVPSPGKLQSPAKAGSPPSRPPPTRISPSAGFSPSVDYLAKGGEQHQSRGHRIVNGTNPNAKYDKVAAAARAAAESADRAVAAARAAARIAMTEPQFDPEKHSCSGTKTAMTGPKFDVEPELPSPAGFRTSSSSSNNRLYQSSSSSDEDTDQRFAARGLRNSRNTSSRSLPQPNNERPPPPPAKGSSCYITSDSYYRNNTDGYRP